MKDRLFLLNPGFNDDDGHGPFYCGDSVAVEGMLSFFPALRSRIAVNYVAFEKPRTPVIDAIDADHQSLPVLLLDGPAAADDPHFAVKTASGKRFIDTESDIRRYLSSRFGVATAR